MNEPLFECCAEYDWICQVDVHASCESLLQLSIKIYQLAADWSPKVKPANYDWWTSVVRRRGNALNDLGVFYLNQAAVVLRESGQLHEILLCIAKCFLTSHKIVVYYGIHML